MPYEDKSASFSKADVLSHIADYDKPTHREDKYKYVSAGIDWGEHAHSVVILGMTTDRKIELMDLIRIPKSSGIEHIEEDLNLVVRELNKYEPDIILPDLGYAGSYDDKLIAYYGLGRVYGVKVRSAESNGDFNAHFSDSDSTVTLDKLTQNLIMMGNMKRGDIRFWRGSQYDARINEFITHWSNVVIRTDEKENQQTHLVDYKKVILRKGPDHYAQSSTYAMVGLDKLMKEDALANRQKTQIDYLDSTIFSPEQTDIQKEYDITNSIEL
jgi:hypothetical protein